MPRRRSSSGKLGPHGCLDEPCPTCGHQPVALVLRGMLPGPPDGESEGFVIVGGCEVTRDDPEFECILCGTVVWADGRSRPRQESGEGGVWVVRHAGGPNDGTTSQSTVRPPGVTFAEGGHYLRIDEDDRVSLLWWRADADLDPDDPDDAIPEPGDLMVQLVDGELRTWIHDPP